MISTLKKQFSYEKLYDVIKSQSRLEAKVSGLQQEIMRQNLQIYVQKLFIK